MTFATATEIASHVQAGETSAVEVARATLARIDKYHAVQPAIWINRVPTEQVIAYAEAVDRRVAAGETLPLAGVPFAIKDNIDLAGVPTTAACPEFEYLPERSATVVDRLIAAGAVPIGKTNLDQFASGLNGTRSPYGAPACVFNRAYISGGSSSGSAVAVGAGLVPIALGTDTAGSGRVPAAINNLFGMKPTKGRWSTTGLVPACRSLDCITVFAHSLADAALVDSIVAGKDAQDDYSRPLEDRPAGKRLGVPNSLNFCGDGQSARLYAAAIDRARAAGYTLVDIDVAFLGETAALLYNGAWVAERTAAMAEMLRSNPDAIDSAVRTIAEGGLGMTAVDAFNDIYKLQHFATRAAAMWEQVDMLLLPTAPTIYRISEMRAAPIVLNSNLGLYTNFVNLLDMSALAIPAGFRSNDTGFGVTLIGPAHADRALLAHAEAMLAATPPTPAPSLDLEDKMEKITVAVVGAHLEGMPLHWQLTSREARFVGKGRTAPTYKLYAMETTPPKPALIHAEGGTTIELELYELDAAAFGSFVAEVPAPLAIGTVTLEDGSEVKGFVAEPRAIDGARDVTEYGGWRAFIASRA